MNMQSEAGELLNMDAGMAEAERLDSYFAQEKKIAASQKDEPGATLGMVRMFSRHGVKMLHIGANLGQTFVKLNGAWCHGPA